MKLNSPQKEIYARERLTAVQAQRLAQEIAFGPVVFQVSRLMLKFGILQLLDNNKKGLSFDEIAKNVEISRYGLQCLLESSLTIGTILLKEERYFLSKAGWFLLNDEIARINLNFNHDVNYLGLYHLEEAIREGKPEGLKVFGNWPTIYEGLSELPKDTQKSWFDFDHYYSLCSFQEAMKIIFHDGKMTLLDVGGNTGRFATECVTHKKDVEVTIMDLPQQLRLMREATKDVAGNDRIHELGANLLDPKVSFPSNYDIIWMSQFLDCFSEEEVVSILSRAAKSMSSQSKLFIMETLWDRQQFETASYCLAQISIYFTAMANGNSKMFYSQDLFRYIEQAGLKISQIHDGLGMGHSLIECTKA